MYGVISPALFSKLTDAALEEVSAWQTRPHPIAWFDALNVIVRQEQRVIKKAIYIALAVNLSGQKEILGMWISPNEGAKFWLSIFTELKNRGLKDIFIVCVDGQRVHRETLAQSEVRGSIPPRIRERKRSEAFDRPVDQLLQLRTSTSVPGLQDSI